MITILLIYLGSALLARALVSIKMRLSPPEFHDKMDEKVGELNKWAKINRRQLINGFCLFPVFNTYFAIRLLGALILTIFKSSKKQ